MLILKLFIGRVRKLSVVRIQTRLANLLPMQVCGWLWLGYWLGVQTCLHQLISFIDIIILQVICLSCLFLIFDLHVFSLLYQRSLFLKLVLVCVRKLSVVCIQTRPMDFLLSQICGRSWQGWRFLWSHISSSIYLLNSSQSSQVIQVCSCVDNWKYPLFYSIEIILWAI